MPVAMCSSPDGSCAFAIESHPTGIVLQAYHWATFGSTNGICLDFPGLTADSWAMMSFVKRSSSNCHFISLHGDAQSLKSIVLDITHKSTEFTFQSEGKPKSTKTGSANTAHTSLINCHREVWIRFPVVPAVRRHTFKSSDRLPRSLAFISPLAPELFSRNYDYMVAKFESTTRKPIGSELTNTQINGFTYTEFLQSQIHNVSRFKAGEWLVDILCLIPIHLAVARDNRFVPLKDGVWSLELERSLLGATVEQVIDRLSFGWYESIFQSYMSNKVSNRLLDARGSNDCLACQSGLING